MLDLVRLPVSLGSARVQAVKQRVTELLAGRRYLGPFLLGVLFTLSFCPFSAVLYFGMLIPLALREHNPLVVPSSGSGRSNGGSGGAPALSSSSPGST